MMKFTGRYLADGGGVPAVALVAVGALHEDRRVAQALREHLACTTHTFILITIIDIYGRRQNNTTLYTSHLTLILSAY